MLTAAICRLWYGTREFLGESVIKEPRSFSGALWAAPHKICARATLFVNLLHFSLLKEVQKEVASLFCSLR